MPGGPVQADSCSEAIPMDAVRDNFSTESDDAAAASVPSGDAGATLLGRKVKPIDIAIAVVGVICFVVVVVLILT